jgi:hypothetical protein
MPATVLFQNLSNQWSADAEQNDKLHKPENSLCSSFGLSDGPSFCYQVHYYTQQFHFLHPIFSRPRHHGDPDGAPILSRLPRFLQVLRLTQSIICHCSDGEKKENSLDQVKAGRNPYSTIPPKLSKAPAVLYLFWFTSGRSCT